MAHAEETATWLQLALKLGKLIHLFIEQANEIRVLQSNSKLKNSKIFGELANIKCKQGQTNDKRKMMNPAYHIAFFNVAGKAK